VAPPPPPPPPPLDLAIFTKSPKSLRVSTTGRFTYTFVATPGRSGTIRLASTKKVKIGAKKRTLEIPARSFSAPAGGTVNTTFKLSAKNLAALKHTTSLPFKVTATVTRTTFTTKLTLKPPKKKATKSKKTKEAKA